MPLFFLQIHKIMANKFFSKFKPEKITKESAKTLAKDYVFILVGCFIMAIGYVFFIDPLKLVPGGVYGIAIVLHHTVGFPIGLAGLCLDLPLLLIGTLWLGPKFGLKTVAGVFGLSGSISLLEFLHDGTPLVSDPSATFILTLFGAVIIGIGLGLIFKSRATSGGTDIIAMILGKYLKHIPIGKLIIAVDSTVVLLSLCIPDFEWTIPLYSWLVIYVEGVVIDMVISGGRSSKAVFIISQNPEPIKQFILNDLQRGGTYLKGMGMYYNEEKNIIYTNVSRKQLPTLIHHVHEVDPKAFLSILEASEVLGEGFSSLQEKASE